MKEIRVLLADEREIFRKGLARLLEEQPHIEVIFECENGKQAVQIVKETEPDVVLMDTDMPECDGIEATKQINKSSPNVKVAMLSDCVDKEKLFSAMEVGARGYLVKNMPFDDLVKSIELIARGEVVISSFLSKRLLSEFASIREEKKARYRENKTGLSKTETEILKLIAKGATNKEIAQTLFIAENTAKVHVKNILGRLQLRNRQQAAAYAVQWGLVTEVKDVSLSHPEATNN